MKDSDLYEAYFYNDSEYYVKKVEAIKDKGHLTFNVYAFFFGIFWFVYRKMYFEAAIITVIAISSSVIFETPRLRFLLSILLGVCFGLLGDRIYIAKATRIITEAKKIYPESDTNNAERDQLHLYLTDKGGVNSTPVWIFVIILGIMFILNLFLALSTGFAPF